MTNGMYLEVVLQASVGEEDECRSAGLDSVGAAAMIGIVKLYSVEIRVTQEFSMWKPLAFPVTPEIRKQMLLPKYRTSVLRWR